MASTKLTTQLKQQLGSNNNIETGKSSIGHFPGELGNHVKQNVATMPDDFFNQLLGIGRSEVTNQEAPPSQSREMTAGQEFVLPKKAAVKEAPKPERRPHIAAGIEYHAEIARNSERMSRRESQEIQYQIQEIMEELKRLVDSSNKIIQMEYGAVTVTTAPKVAGKYHTNYLAWMLVVIRTARQKVEDSGAWLSVAKGKGSKKGYWNMFKSHGTSFGMSNERQVSTQTG